MRLRPHLGPLGRPKGRKGPPKATPRRSPGRAKTLPKMPQDHPKTPRPPKTPPRGAQYPPKSAQDPPRPPQEPPEVLINWRGGTKAQPSSIRRPIGHGVWNGDTRSPDIFSKSPSRFFFSEVLVFPLLNPPPVASGRLHLLRRSAALARLGASWAEKVAFQEAFQN